MEMKSVLRKGSNILKKYRYAILVLVIGLVLMLIPGNNIADGTVKTDQPITDQSSATLDETLARTLEKVRGAGKVTVLLTTAAGEETIYQTDEDMSENSNRYTTVTITDAERNEAGLIRQVNPPVYLGALIVCEGADDPAVCLAIVSAVSRVTGLGANQISVLKMK